MTPERGIAALLLASMVASVGLLLLYVFGPSSAPLEGALLAVALGGVGGAIVVWAVSLMHAPPEVEERHELASPAAEREATPAAADVESMTRRRFLVRLLGGAGALLAAALALPAFSLGPQPGRELFETGWRRGVRVVGTSGEPIRPEDLVERSVQTVFPDGEVGRADSQTMLIRLRPEDLQLPAGRETWTPQGCVGYSKVCTHAGCPVGLYRSEDQVLICPCHQSTFDVTRGAIPVFGPAARPLPQLPLEVDGQGYLVAAGAFSAPVGPSFWNLTLDAPAEDAG
ncbi:MAG TPA: Rieske 2Fe-2S domain-containing protein [Candidatus Limnocylindria bacterium]|nr:Rieske 2Fe-2S domain-containing protein [Candidatus Limnocylindria bacterium]